jgi:cytochrome P450
MDKLARPEHVPPHLVRDFDYCAPPGLVDGYSEDIHAVWKNVQDSMPPIFWTPRHGGHWVLTRFKEIQEATMNPAVFSNRENQLPFGITPTFVPVNADPPEHGMFRRLLMPWFSPARIALVTDRARGTAIDIIEKLKPQGHCEFFSDFAGVMPLVAFLTLVNMPVEDLVYLRTLSGNMMPANPKAPAAWAEMGDYVRAKIEDRRLHPQEDLFSSLHVAVVDGRKLTEKEIFEMGLLMIAGGLDTVVAETCFIAAFLAQNPAHREELRQHPERLDNAMEELFRRFGVSNLARVVSKDVEFSGIPFRKDDGVLLPFPLAGLDETVTENPLMVDFQRKSPRLLLFSTGPHSCIGNRLAKREIKIFLEEWLTRIPDFTLSADHKPKMRTGVINQVDELHLSWKVWHMRC